MPAFALTAVLCPPLLTPAALLVPETDAPVNAAELELGDTTSLLTKFNENASRLDVTGRRGGGAYAVLEGLDISASALTCTVTAGQAMLDGPVTRAASGTVALADNAYNWVYLLQDGTLTKTSGAGTTPPAAPAAACAFLGRIQVTASVAGTEDYSGRWELRCGTLWRRTGDAGVPGDTPAAGLLFFTRTAGGVYLHDGVGYVTL